jgi:hypothetical protein
MASIRPFLRCAMIPLPPDRPDFFVWGSSLGSIIARAIKTQRPPVSRWPCAAAACRCWSPDFQFKRMVAISASFCGTVQFITFYSGQQPRWLSFPGYALTTKPGTEHARRLRVPLLRLHRFHPVHGGIFCGPRHQPAVLLSSEAVHFPARHEPMASWITSLVGTGRI